MTSRTMSMAFILLFAALWFGKMDPKITFFQEAGEDVCSLGAYNS